jgi:hypothetical protein
MFTITSSTLFFAKRDLTSKQVLEFLRIHSQFTGGVNFDLHEFNARFKYNTRMKITKGKYWIVIELTGDHDVFKRQSFKKTTPKKLRKKKS